MDSYEFDGNQSLLFYGDVPLSRGELYSYPPSEAPLSGSQADER